MKKSLFPCLLTFLMISSLSLAQNKPNVVLIMADDVSWEAFTCYGGQDYKTPNIDRLAAEGIRFDHCYSTPICTPSRVKIMTGKYNFRNYTHFGYLNPKEKTFGNLLKQAGYETVIGGKWQLNGLYNHKQFEDCYDKMRPRKFGFDEYCLWQLTKGRGQGERFWNPCLETNGKLTTPQDNKGKYGPDIISDYICDFIERKKDQPFFVYYPMVLVHEPFWPTPDNIEGLFDSKSKRKYFENKKNNFAAMMEYMDKIVGKIVKKIDQVGQLDNTIIIFTADNGTHRSITSRWNNRDIKGGKGSMTDMGTHVPLIAYWKEHTPKGVVLDDLIDFTDFYPTLADAANIKLGKDDPIDGRSFFPRLKGQKGNPREWVLNHYNPYWGRNFEVGQFVRNQDYKLYNDGRFYNVPEDIMENNLIENPKANTKVADSRKMLQKILDKCPPAPKKPGKRNDKVRPLFPNTPSLHDLCGKKNDSFKMFAFDNYMMAGKYKNDNIRAEILKELGYDGMSYHGTKNLVKTVKMFDDFGLKLFITYLGVNIDAEEPAGQYDPNLKNTIKQLKGTDTMIWVYLTSKKYRHPSEKGDAAAVEILRDLAETAQRSDIKIVLYPHVGVYSESFADALRIARKINRSNVGVSFNVCHWLKLNGDIDYRPILKEALPYLFVVTTNGAETGDTKKMGWNKLIQTLDKGTFDNYKFLKYLKDIGYNGPVGLQGYSIKGDPKQNLERSIKAWREIKNKINEYGGEK